MENGDRALEGSERSPLLDKEIQASNHYEENESVEVHQRTHSYSKALPIILGYSFLEGIAFNGVGINLVLYLGSVLHGSTSSNATNVAVWGGTSYFTPLIGGFLADTYWGNYKTVFISSILYLLGIAVVTLTAAVPSLRPPPCDGSFCQPATGAQMFIFLFGMYLIALGCGGTRSALLPFGADQFNDKNPAEVKKKVSFFSWFYVCSMLGVLVAGLAVVWIQENISWTIGFGISTLCIAIAGGGFVLGTPTYKLRMPTGSPLKSVLQVVVACFRKMHLETPTDAKLLYDVNQDGLGQKRLAHTDDYRFLDKAAMTTSDLETSSGSADNSWTLCTITQVEELKILLRMLPIWGTSIVYTAACTQMNSTFIQQGSVMDTEVGSISIPPASLSSFGVICVMVWVFIYDMLINPAIQRYSPGRAGLSNLQRMGIGRFTMIISMLTAAVVETERLECVRKGENLSILWQFPQYFIISASEVFNYITQLEFFYAQAPDSMRSICTSFALLSTALGNYLSSLIITIVSAATARGNPGWIPNDLNKGHLDYYFYTLAGMCTVNFCVYVVFARKYKLKKVI